LDLTLHLFDLLAERGGIPTPVLLEKEDLIDSHEKSIPIDIKKPLEHLRREPGDRCGA
jgi:hypothetical protein